MNARLTALLLLLLLVMVGSGWFLYQQDDRQQQTPASVAGHDSFVRGMDLKVMDIHGQLQYHVMADSMFHFPHQERLKLDRPDIDFRREDGTSWHITAERGETTASGDRVWLLGQVDINRAATGRTGSLQIRTSDLLVMPDLEQAETGSAATITAKRYRVEATGLKADFRSNQLQLLSNVRGTIDGKG